MVTDPTIKSNLPALPGQELLRIKSDEEWFAARTRLRDVGFSNIIGSMVPNFSSKPSHRTAPKTAKSFVVDDVTAAADSIWTETLADSLSKRFRRNVLLLPESGRPVANLMIDSIGNSLRVRSFKDACTRCHPLIEAVHTAFSQHRPLRLSPDAIWLVIAQGFSHHAAANSEALRHRLVRHEGTRELVEKVLDLSLESLEGAISGFSSQIRGATDPVLHETLVCDFSTTTPDIRTASEVVLLDSFSSYFEYVMHCICGIPAIAIEGSLDDWQRIRARVEVLETFGLEWWVARLRPILDEFVLAAEGHSTREFWQAIYKPKKSYGGSVATGWITDLFPYLGDGPARFRNPVLETERQDWALPIAKGMETGRPFYPGPGVGERGFPSGLCSVPVNLNRQDLPDTGLDLVAGFFGMEQIGTELSLSPVIGWCLTERAPKKAVSIRWS